MWPLTALRPLPCYLLCFEICVEEQAETFSYIVSLRMNFLNLRANKLCAEKLHD